MEYIKEEEVEKITGVKVGTLRQNRYKKRGFPYYKVGGKVLYKEADIIEYIERHKVEHGKSEGSILDT